MIYRFTAYGVPEPKGSLSAVVMPDRKRGGRWTTIGGKRACIEPRAVMLEGRNVKRADGTRSDGRQRMKRWREAVEQAAVARWTRAEKLDGPLAVSISFYLPRPPSTPRTVLYPAKKPDLDKCFRLAADCLTDLIFDDSRIVRLFAEKLYADAGRPRAIVTIETLPATLDELRYEQAREGTTT